MLQRWTGLLATTAALVAILLGLWRHWEFWAVVERAVAAYLVMYGTIGILFALAHLALRSEPPRPHGRAGKPRERLGTSGTDSADSV